MRKVTFLTPIISGLICLLSMKAVAQKLPAVQSIGIKAPANIKIDGKQSEWGSSFQAYNNAIECSYTIADDANNLYLIIQATNNSIVQKIATGGISFTVGDISKKNDPASVTITFLKTPDPYSAGISYELRTRKFLPDDVISTLNNQVTGHIKNIEITGAKGVTDSTISIYNNLGIKTAGFIDRDKVYTCELAIPLKYISQNVDASGAFKYRIQINGMDTSGKDGFIVVGGHAIGSSDKPADHLSTNFQLSPTYVNGAYTLVK